MSFFANLMHGLGAGGGQMSQSFEEIQRQDLARAEARAREAATNKQLYQTAVQNMQTYETNRLDREQDAQQHIENLAQQRQEARDLATWREQEARDLAEYRAGTLAVSGRQAAATEAQVNQTTIDNYNRNMLTDPSVIPYGPDSTGRIRTMDVGEMKQRIMDAQHPEGSDFAEDYSRNAVIAGLKRDYGEELTDTDINKILAGARGRESLTPLTGTLGDTKELLEEKGGGFWGNLLGLGGKKTPYAERAFGIEHEESGYKYAPGMSPTLDQYISQDVQAQAAAAAMNQPMPAGALPVPIMGENWFGSPVQRGSHQSTLSPADTTAIEAENIASMRSQAELEAARLIEQGVPEETVMEQLKARLRQIDTYTYSDKGAARGGFYR